MVKLRKILKAVLVAVGVCAGAFVGGALFFNFLFMPWFVKLGREVEVPDVCGKSLVEARTLLRDMKLNYYIKSYIPDPVFPKDFVIRQGPSPNKIVKVGKKVGLIISLGPELIKMPYLEGLDKELAVKMLESKNLKVGTIRQNYSDFTIKGRVIRTDPPAGSEVKMGEEIDLIVSGGRLEKKFDMPNLLGVELDDAKTTIEEKGLVIGSIQYIESDGEEGIVLLQGPLPGVRISRGDTIELGVSSKIGTKE